MAGPGADHHLAGAGHLGGPVSAEVVAAGLASGSALLAGIAAGRRERQRLLWRVAGPITGEVVSAPRDLGPAGISAARPRKRPILRARWFLDARPQALAACAVAAAAVGAAMAGWIGALSGAAGGAALPSWLRGRRLARRATMLEEQLGDAMDGIAAALRAGMSPSQAIAFAAAEGEPPLADSLRAVGERETLGVPLDESLETWASSEAGDDVRLAVSVLQLQHRVGGNAPAMLEEAVRTLRQRAAAARELRSLTAQARLSGAILGALPIGFFLFMSVVSRREVSLALHSKLGIAAVLGGLLLDGFAFLWIRHLLREAA